ncbi:MAG: hypothetical protein CM15mP102_12920 [Flavobacteriales bacterium]|nr:MAG: hypothetical protein CM15mP102_12920 [Flavobacteriales bacterium]
MTPYQDVLNNKPLSIEEKCETFDDEIILVENIKKYFFYFLGKAFEKYGQKLKKSASITSLSDLAIEAYLSESTLKRTIKNINRVQSRINLTK